MKKIILNIKLLTLLSSISVSAQTKTPPVFVATPKGTVIEDFKGPLESPEYHFGVMTGLGVLNSKAGWVLLPTISKKIVHQGFVPDISNQVFIEITAGPIFVLGSSAFVYSTHLRWDFKKDEQWTLYAVGGLGGHVTGVSLGSQWVLMPRFAGGVFLKLSSMVKLRIEASHEWIALGASYQL